jgi:hypothetical protein
MAMYDTGITTDYLESLGKQMFIKETILNGMFPCQSDFVKLIRNKKQDWSYHEFYEYRMLLANSNTGGGLNSELFSPDGSLRKPGEVDIGIFRASYGVVSDGFDIDMISNIETSSNKKAFLTDYAKLLHSMRMNVAAIFKNVAIKGRFGVVHRIALADAAIANATGTGGTAPGPGVPFVLTVPSDVYASGFGKGRYLIKTLGDEYDSPANCAEIYYIIDNQPKRLTLVALNGSTPTTWQEGQFLELSDNRMTENGAVSGNIVAGTPYPTWQATNPGQYTHSGSPNGAQTGFMEGLADLFPWNTPTNNINTRYGLNRPFRGLPNRQTWTTQTAGGFYPQQPGESIIDAIMGGVRLATLAVPYSELGVWMNHDTRLAIGAQEADSVRIFKQIAISQPIVFQRGVTATTYTVGSKEIPDTISDDNFPTDVVIIAPKSDLSYCTLDNSFMEIDRYIQKTFSSEAPPTPENIHVPDELVTSLNIGKRFVVGRPTIMNGRTSAYGGFVHPGNRVPVLYHEMGSLYTENPYAYVIVKLLHPIINPSDAANW